MVLLKVTQKNCSNSDCDLKNRNPDIRFQDTYRKYFIRTSLGDYL